MPFRIADIDPQGDIPAIGDGHQPRVESRSKGGDDFRERIVKVLVFAAPETMACHHDPAAKDAIVRVQAGENVALGGVQNTFEDRAALRIKVARDPIPVEGLDAGDGVVYGDG